MIDPDEPRRSDPRSRAIGRFATTRHAEGADWSSPDPETRQALEEVVAFWRDLDVISGEEALDAMRREARDRLTAAAPPRRSRGAMRAAGLVTLALAVLVALGITMGPGSRHWLPGGGAVPAYVDQQKVIANGVAAPRTVVLNDGTRVTLDASSSVGIARWTSGERSLVLHEGRAFFDVAHDRARPFQVRIGNTMVTDVGTQFEVSAKLRGAAVALVEGRIEARVGNDPSPIDLRPGTRLDVANGQWTLTRQAVNRMAEWRSGVLRLENVPLDEAVAQLNRYLPNPLIVRAGADRTTRISGVFRLDDPDGLFTALSIMGKGQVVRPERPKG